MALELSPLSRLPLREHARLAIRQAVLDGVLAQGSHIVEEELAAQLGVSRAPLREAIRLLEQEGLVMSIPRVGSFVRQLTARDLEEIWPLRVALESLAIELAIPRATDGDISSLQRCTDSMRKAALEERHQQFLESDLSFHEQLVRLAGNQRLFDSWFTIMMQFRILAPLSELLTLPVYRDFDGIIQAHQVVIDAFAARKVGHTQRLLQQHTSLVCTHLLARMTQQQRQPMAGAEPNGRA